MTARFHERIDILTRRERCLLTYAVGFVASALAIALDRCGAAPAGLVLLGLTAAFLARRFVRELRPDRLALPPEMRFIQRKPRS